MHGRRHRIRGTMLGVLVRVAGAALLLLRAGSSAGAENAGDAAPPAEPSLITTVGEFWALPADDARPHPVRMELLVHYYDPAWGPLWGSSGGAPGYFPADRELSIRSGQRILITGTLARGGQLSKAGNQWTVLDPYVPIEGVPVAGQMSHPERFEARMVTMEGYVVGQSIVEERHLVLPLIVEGHSVLARMWFEGDNPVPPIVDARVRIKGVFINKPDIAGNTLAVDLWVPRAEDIEVLGWLRDEPGFRRAATAISELPARPETELVRVVGIVRGNKQGRSVTLRDASGEVVVRTLQRTDARMGDAMEAIGYPAARGFEWSLEAGLVRPLQTLDEVASIRESPGALPTLRLADQVLELPAEEAGRHHPVRLNGVVLWSDPAADFLFLRDTSGSIQVAGVTFRYVPPDPGSVVIVNGTSAAGTYAPVVEAGTVEVLGNLVLPDARPITLEQAMTGVEEAQWVELRGYVREVATEEPWTRLDLVTTSGEFTAKLRSRAEYAALHGSVVVLRGVCTGLANESRQLTGIVLWVGGPLDVEVEEPAPEDLFSVPLRSIASLRKYSTLPSHDRLIRVEAAVTHHVPGHSLFVDDGSDGLWIASRWDEPLRPGEVVEAVGLPGTDGNHTILREAVFRPTGRTASVPVARIDDPRAVTERLDSRLVSMTGTLLKAVDDGRAFDLTMQSGDGVVAATLLHEGLAAGLANGWQPGSQLVLTGVCRIAFDERRRPQGFRLEMRSPADVVVLSRPTWLTAGRALAFSGVLAGIVVAGFGWVAALRRRVTQQTRQIRHQYAKEAKLEARHRGIIENASDFIFTTDGDGRFTSFNRAGERITGYTAAEALELDIRDLIAAEDPDHPHPWTDLMPGQDGVVTFQGRLRTKSSSEIWVETSARLIEEAGKAAGMLGVARDITGRKEIEEELKRARNAAEANTQAKSAFLANMSHEIRTPMNGVIGMSNLLLDTRLDAEQHDFAQTIRNSAEALLTVLNDILDFSKIEAGKLHLEALDFDLNDLVEETLELLSSRAAVKRLELAALLAHELPRKLRGDSTRLRQVLLNLVGNAVKFTEHGEVVVTVSLEQEDADDVRLRFEVADTGIGMTGEVMSRLFQPFTQADGTTTRRFGGTGLGLAISKQIVELMGGTIGVRSNPGDGSTFWFSVKLQRQPAGAEPPPQPGLETLRGLRALGVDDNSVNRKVLSYYASGWQMRFESVSNAGDALAHLQHAAEAGDPFRIVLLDWLMPGTDGLELARAIADEPLLAGVPAILLTSLDCRLARDERIARNITTVLTKPIRQGELLQAILRAVAPETVPAAASDPASADAAPQGPVQPEPAPLPLHILVAEDNAVNQRLVQLQLKKLGYDSHLVGDGREAIHALEHGDYDVVLMDCQMPEMDGYETTRRLRQHPRLSRIRVIAMTANAMQGDREKCLAAGMDDYLSKPTRVEDLRAALARAAEAASSAAAPATGPG